MQHVPFQPNDVTSFTAKQIKTWAEFSNKFSCFVVSTVVEQGNRDPKFEGLNPGARIKLRKKFGHAYKATKWPNHFLRFYSGSGIQTLKLWITSPLFCHCADYKTAELI
jgi:hypothetical protein